MEPNDAVKKLSNYHDTQANTRELKAIRLSPSVAAFDTTGQLFLLNGVGAGDDSDDRDGRQITNKTVQILGLLSPQSTVTSSNLARVLVVWDSQSNGTTPAITDILLASSSVSFPRLDNRQRFDILADVKYAQAGIAVDFGVPQGFCMGETTHVIDISVDLKNRITTYSGTGFTAANISTGALWLITIGHNPANTGGTAYLTTQLRYFG